MSGGEAPPPPHVLVCPFPASGHLIPLLDLTRRLAPVTAVTILVTTHSLPLISSFLSSHPDIATLVLPLPPHPDIPPDIENVSHLPTSLLPAMLHALADLHDPLLSWFRSHPSPPRFIVSDMFLCWTHRVASQLGIKNIVFSPSAAITISILICLWEDLPSDRKVDFVSFERVPNCPKYPWWQTSPLYRSFLEGNPDGEFVKEIFLCNAKSWGMAINTFEELEKPYLDHLRKRMGSDRVWAVGPLLPAPDDQEASARGGGTSSVPVDRLMKWLDGCRDQEVVYVCFGSRTVLNEGQTARVASGLEKSGARFLWSAGRDMDGQSAGILTELEEKKRGVVIRGWAPQLAILSHRAVGAFLTHCGWNSVLEGIVAGVKMLTWAMTADQFMDAKLLVEELKVGVRVCEGGDALPDPDELGRVVAEAVSEERSEIRERVSRLRTAAMEAIEKDVGSSAKDLDGLLKHFAGLES